MPSTIELNQADPVVGIAADTVPCIDAAELLSGDRHGLAETVRAACLETGFFYIDVTSEQCAKVAATLLQMKYFFALDDSDKRKQDVRQNDCGYGWVPKYTEPAYQPDTVSSLEAFDCGLANIEGTVDGWPQMPDFRSSVTDCWKNFVVLGEAILELLGRAVRIDPNFFVERCSSKSLNKMRLLHYSEAVTQIDDRAVGIAAHTDFECITLLYQTAPGLELLNVNGDWLDAPVRDGRIVVLLGDMLERWTNGLFKASGHRVRNTHEQRFSIVMFLAANEEIEVAPLPDFVSTDKPAHYAPITQAQHIENELKRSTNNASAE